MKYIFLFLLLSVTSVLLSQEIPKKANTAAINGLTFKDVANVLMDSGYVILKSDKELGTIQTEFRQVSRKLIPYVAFQVRIKDSTAFFSSRFDAPTSSISRLRYEDATTVDNTNWPASKICWKEFIRITQAFKQPVTYLIK